MYRDTYQKKIASKIGNAGILVVCGHACSATPRLDSTCEGVILVDLGWCGHS